MSRVQSTVISAGTELERIILSKVEKIDDLDEFLEQEIMEDGVLIASKRQIKKCHSLTFPNAEPDFLIFKRRSDRQACHVVELKDGHAFDTKKSSAEHWSIHSLNALANIYRTECPPISVVSIKIAETKLLLVSNKKSH